MEVVVDKKVDKDADAEMDEEEDEKSGSIEGVWSSVALAGHPCKSLANT